jgi:hypothetical protein
MSTQMKALYQFMRPFIFMSSTRVDLTNFAKVTRIISGPFNNLDNSPTVRAP